MPSPGKTSVKRLILFAVPAAAIIAVAVTAGVLIGRGGSDGSSVSAQARTADVSSMNVPSLVPSASPSSAPSTSTANPTVSANPTITPSLMPSDDPSEQPTTSMAPSDMPSSSPSTGPTGRPSDMPTETPSSVPSLEPTGAPSASPTEYPTLEPGPPLFVFDDAIVESVYPLGQCQGDCDEDEHCEGDLICFRRDGGSNWVPGCSGTTDEGGADICIDPADEPEGPIGPTPGSFRLKMYWEEGYRWQEDPNEKFYCMECDGSCRSGNQLEVQNCDSRNAWFEFITFNGLTQIKLAEDDLCIEVTGTYTTELQNCVDPTEDRPRQKFVALNGSFNNGGKFEIGTVHTPGCLTQQHHPRPGEVIKREHCPDTRDDDTSFWVKY